jgi:chromosome partitioning protein
MPTIAFISPKGGVGKTTAATLLATQLGRRAKVTVIDADPNRPVTAWAKRGRHSANVTVVSDATQENIIDKIDEAALSAPFVIVDCEGTASLTVAYAIGAADLVIVPTQGSQLDAKEAARALSLVKNQERQSRRKILHAILYTRTSPVIRPRSLVHIQTEFAKLGVLLLKTQLNEREAFRAMFSFGGGLEDLPEESVSNVEKAVINARSFASEIIEILRTHAAEEREGEAA